MVIKSSLISREPPRSVQSHRAVLILGFYSQWLDGWALNGLQMKSVDQREWTSILSSRISRAVKFNRKSLPYLTVREMMIFTQNKSDIIVNSTLTTLTYIFTAGVVKCRVWGVGRWVGGSFLCGGGWIVVCEGGWIGTLHICCVNYNCK